MAKNRPTLKDVAELAGVSPASASLALRGMGDSMLSGETSRRVLRAARKLKYRHNALAASLRRGKSDVVAFLLAQLSTPTLAAKTTAAQEAIHAHGLRTVFWLTSEDPTMEGKALDDIRSHMVSGVVAGYRVGKSGAARLRDLADDGVPIVLFEPHEEISAPVVTVNREAVTRIATQHLLGLGHRRIALAGSAHFVDLVNGWGRGYAQALKRRRVAVDRKLVHEVDAATTFEAGFRVAAQLLSMAEPPTALVCSDDEVAVGAIKACRARGARVPDDLAIVGFDDLPVAAYAEVPLTTIGHPAAEAGRQAAEILLADIDAGEVSPPKTVVLEPDLIVRDSCGASAHGGT